VSDVYQVLESIVGYHYTCIATDTYVQCCLHMTRKTNTLSDRQNTAVLIEVNK